MTKILVAEDNQTLLESITLELEMRGYEVLSAVNGGDALHILLTSEQIPDIIVSDIAMPDVDGYKLLEHIRADMRLSAVPVLFLTAFNSPNSVRLSKELGVDDYIVKPFQADDLVIAIENKLKRIRAFQTQADHRLDQSRQTLLHMISHELRTPLTAIYGGSELLAEILAEVPDETVHHMLGLIQNGAHRLNRLTGKALALIDIDSGNLQRVFVRSRRNHLVQDVVEAAIESINHENAADQRRVTIMLNSCTDHLLVEGVYEYLVMIIAELLRNAVAFTPSGGEVHVSVRRNTDNIEVTIKDSGRGIAESDLHRVWERFTQIDRDQYEQQGSGLGLAVVREVARIHGGECTIISELGKGTQVTLTLP